MTKFTVQAFFVTLLCVTVLYGCINSHSSDNHEITTISIWHPNTHAKKYFEEKVAEYNETTGRKKGIKIQYECKPNLVNLMPASLADGTAPDIVMELSDMATQQAAEKGQIVALNDIPGGQEIIDKYEDYIYPNGFDNKTYKVPYHVYTRALIYNKDMFKAAGIVDENGEPTPPTTYDEVAEYAKRLTNPDKNQYGIIIPVKWIVWSNEWFGVLMNSTGSRGYDPKTGTYDYSCIRPLAEMYYKIKANGSYMPGAESLDLDPARACFAEGNIGMKFSMSYDVGVLTDQFPAKCDWGVAQLPFVDENIKYMQDAQVNQFACVNAKSVEEKGADKILEVYKWFISDEIMKDMYKKGYFIPILYDTIKDIPVNEIEAPKQWIDYGNLLKISVNSPAEMPRDYGDDLHHSKCIRAYLWTQKWTVDEVIDYINRASADGIVRYKEKHPGFNGDVYIKKDWDVTRKD
ncbi:MAG: carbohydrate ABC transporter substrate-binding protein [Clostridia bacterium]|nr:carbohydrate ABC transporter substrate-binding protein [Clostridia bacterium]